MAIVLYGLKNCDTCRKAQKVIKSKGLQFQFVDVRETPLSRETLERIVATFNEDVINRRSTTWRALSDEDRTKNALNLLEAYPTLMKRPVIDADGLLHLGWTPKVQDALSL